MPVTGGAAGVPADSPRLLTLTAQKCCRFSHTPTQLLSLSSNWSCWVFVGEDGNWQAAQEALIKRAAANSAAQQGKYDSSQEDKAAGESTYEKGYVY